MHHSKVLPAEDWEARERARIAKIDSLISELEERRLKIDAELEERRKAEQERIRDRESAYGSDPEHVDTSL